MRLSSILRKVPACWFTVLAVAALVPHTAWAEAPISLSAEQVACNAGQLGRLLGRTVPLREEVADGAGTAALGALDGGWTLFATYADPFGAYEGLLVGPRTDPPAPERQLAFVLQPSIRELLLNPERPPLSQVTLAREDSASTLTGVGATDRLALALDPTLDPVPRAVSSASLVIDDGALGGETTGTGQARPASTRPGRGLDADGLTALCHLGLTREDLRLFALIQRLLRLDLRDGDGTALGAAVALYRDRAPDHLRADVYPRPTETADGGASTTCRFSLEIDFERAEDRSLRRARLRQVEPVGEGLPACTGAAIAGEAFLVPANRAGGPPWSRGEASEALQLGGSGSAPGDAVADLDRLLDGSRWNRPGPAPVNGCSFPTDAELAASPRRDVNVESMAVTLGVSPGVPQDEAGDRLLADPALYRRIRADQEAIARLDPLLPEGFPSFSEPTHLGRMILRIDGGPNVRDAVTSDPLFRCLTGQYDIAWTLFDQTGGGPTRYLVRLQLSRVMNLNRLAEKLGQIPGVAEVTPEHLISDPSFNPELCLRRGTEPGSLEYWLGGEQWYLSTAPGVVERQPVVDRLPEPSTWTCAPFGPTSGQGATVEGSAVASRSERWLHWPGAQPTPEQIACNRGQLRGLFDRLRVLGPAGEGPARPTTVFVSPGDPAGRIDGLLVSRDLPPADGSGGETEGPEGQLSFHLDTAVRDLLLNPERPPLDQVVLARETSTSILVPPSDPFQVAVVIDPTLGASAGGGDGAAETGGIGPSDLVIDNLAAPPASGAGDRAAATRPGRGLLADHITTVCHARLDSIDRRMFSLLERTLRFDLTDPATGTRYAPLVALYAARQSSDVPPSAWGVNLGGEPPIYGADVYLVDPRTGARLPGRLVLELTVWSSAGPENLFPYTIAFRILGPEGDLPPVAGTVALRPPVLPGVEAPAPALGVQSVAEAEGGGPWVEVRWDDLLAGTAWGWSRR